MVTTKNDGPFIQPERGFAYENDSDGGTSNELNLDFSNTNKLPSGTKRNSKLVAQSKLQQKKLFDIYHQSNKQQSNSSSSMSSLSTTTAKSTAKSNNNTTSNTNKQTAADTSDEQQCFVCDRESITTTIKDQPIEIKEGDVIKKKTKGDIEVLSIVFTILHKNRKKKLRVIDIYNSKDDETDFITLQKIRDACNLPTYDISLSSVSGVVCEVAGWDQICHVCGNDDDDDQILCDGCGGAYHRDCIPKIAAKNIGSDEWKCPACAPTIACSRDFIQNTQDYETIFDMVQKKLVGNNPPGEEPEYPWQLRDISMSRYFPPALLRVRYAMLEYLEGKDGKVTLAVEEDKDEELDKNKKRKSASSDGSGKKKSRGSSASSDGSGKKPAAGKNEEASTTTTPTKDDESPASADDDELPSQAHDNATRRSSTASSGRDKKSSHSSEGSEDESSREGSKKPTAKTSNEPSSARSSAPRGGSGNIGHSTLDSNNLPSAQALDTLPSAPELTVKPPTALHKHKHTNLTLLTKRDNPKRTTYEATSCGVTSIIVVSGEVTCRVNRCTAMGYEDEIYSLADNTLPIQLVNGDTWKLENWSQNYEARVTIVESMF